MGERTYLIEDIKSILIDINKNLAKLQNKQEIGINRGFASIFNRANEQIQNQYNITAPISKKYPEITSQKIYTINSSVYNFTIFSIKIFFYILLLILPLILYSHFYNLENIFTKLSLPTQLGYILFSSYSLGFIFITLYYILYPLASIIYFTFKKNARLTNSSFMDINFSNVRQIRVDTRLFQKKIFFYLKDKSIPKEFVIIREDHLVLVKDVYLGYLNSNNSHEYSDVFQQLSK